MSEKPTVFIPGRQHGHKGDTFRELADMWREMDLVTIQESPDRFCWWQEPGLVLLHDHPMITHLPEYKLGLFGNQQGQGENDYPWIFWARNPRKLDQFVRENDTSIEPEYRYWQSTFVGKVENNQQAQNRFQSKINWFEHIHLFQVVAGVQTQYPFDMETYLQVMSKTKFALLLPGYGPKCNRDIEAVACGAIPIVTPGVDTEYYGKWTEGKNYFRMNDVSDLKGIFESDPEKLLEMQTANTRWYNRNASPEGSFKTTKRIIETRLK